MSDNAPRRYRVTMILEAPSQPSMLMSVYVRHIMEGRLKAETNNPIRIIGKVQAHLVSEKGADE